MILHWRKFSTPQPTNGGDSTGTPTAATAASQRRRRLRSRQGWLPRILRRSNGADRTLERPGAAADNQIWVTRSSS